MEIEERISVEIGKFEESLKALGAGPVDEKAKKIIELAEMYAKDAQEWLGRKEFYSAFASIYYAHGLLDALLKMRK